MRRRVRCRYEEGQYRVPAAGVVPVPGGGTTDAGACVCVCVLVYRVQEEMQGV